GHPRLQRGSAGLAAFGAACALCGGGGPGGGGRGGGSGAEPRASLIAARSGRRLQVRIPTVGSPAGIQPQRMPRVGAWPPVSHRRREAPKWTPAPIEVPSGELSRVAKFARIKEPPPMHTEPVRRRHPRVPAGFL